MAHHLGMSLAAIDNCLMDDIFCRRFMADPAMSAHRCLLEERLPIGAVTLRSRGGEIPEKPQRAPWPRLGAGRSLPGRRLSPLLPRVERGLSPHADLERPGLGLRRRHQPIPRPGLASAARRACAYFSKRPEGRTDLLPLPGA